MTVMPNSIQSDSESRHSKESLTEKLASRIPYGDRRRSTRKRLSLASETSNSTAGSSSATPAPSDPIAILSNPNHEETNRSRNRRRKSSISSKEGRNSLLNGLDQDGEQKVKDATSGRTRSRGSVGGRSRESTKAARSSTSNKATEDTTTTSRGSSFSRGRSAKAQHHTHTTGTAQLQTNEPLDSNKSHRSSSSPTTRRIKKSSSSTATSQSSGSNNNNSNSSLRSFMQKATSQLKPDTEEALEVKSAFTSASRYREKKKSSSNPRDKYRSKKGGQNDLGSSSYHGDSARRYTSALQDLTRTSRGGSVTTLSIYQAMTSRSISRTRLSNDPRADGSNANESNGTTPAAASTLQEDETYSAPSRKIISDKPQRRTSSTVGGQKLDDQQYHQGFRGLSVLPEESKKPKRDKPMKKSRSSSTKSGGISPQELSDFLDQCNAKRRQKEAPSLSSPIRGDRSCVSMPAAISSLGGKRRKSSKMSPLPSYKATYKHRQQSQRSFQTSSSDPCPPSKGSKPQLETLAKKQTRTRPQSKDRGRKKDAIHSRSGKHDKATPGGASSSISNEASSFTSKLRSKSVNKDANYRKDKEEADRARSLSCTRHAPQPTRLAPPQSETKTISAKGSLNKMPRGGSGGLQKLFSIRDIQPENNDITPDSTPPYTESLDREATKEDETALLKTHSNLREEQGGMDGSLLIMTPPSPLSPFLPIKKDRARSNAKPAKSQSPKRPTRRRRLSTASAVVVPGDEAGGRQGDSRRPARRHSSHGVALNEKHEKQKPTTSMLRNRNENNSQVTGDDTEENESKRRMDPYRVVEVQRRKAAEDESDEGIEQDVFSHYTWSSAGIVSRQERDENRRGRQQLKDSIRQSVLYKAFDAIEDAL